MDINMQCMDSNIGQVTLDIQIMVIILRHTTPQHKGIIMIIILLVKIIN